MPRVGCGRQPLRSPRSRSRAQHHPDQLLESGERYNPPGAGGDAQGCLKHASSFVRMRSHEVVDRTRRHTTDASNTNLIFVFHLMHRWQMVESAGLHERVVLASQSESSGWSSPGPLLNKRPNSATGWRRGKTRKGTPHRDQRGRASGICDLRGR